MSWNAVVILSPGFEETEAITVIDILRRASVPVTTASLTDEMLVKGSHDITVKADTLFQNLDLSLYNVIVLPGGLQGVENMLNHSGLITGIKALNDREGILAAVCAAPLVLDTAGILNASDFTCHPTVRHRLSDSSRLKSDAAVRSGRIITGRSAGCAMTWSIALAEHLCGKLPDAFYSGLNCPDA